MLRIGFTPMSKRFFLDKLNGLYYGKQNRK